MPSGACISKQKIMDYKTLIEKYFAGTTTLEEEKRLKAYFNSQEVVEKELEKYIPLFRFLDAEKSRSLPAGFERRLDAELSVPQARRFRLNPIRVAAAAAIFALALIAGTLVYREISPAPEAPVATIDWSKYEPKTKEEALQITRNALMKVSEGLNRGVRILEKGD